jgi:hypothetical protein
MKDKEKNTFVLISQDQENKKWCTHTSRYYLYVYQVLPLVYAITIFDLSMKNEPQYCFDSYQTYPIFN